MVNIEQPLASDTSHVLREMLQNKENVFQAHANTNSDAMQECGENATKSDNVIIGGRHNDTVSDHSDRSEGSIDGSDEESSSLEQTRMDETEVGDSKYEADDDKFVEDSVPDNNKDITRARLENINTSVHNPFIDPELGGYGVSEIRRAKRKQNYPQQHESNAKMPKTDGHFEDEFWQYNQRFNSMQNYFKHLSETAKQLNGYSSLDELHRLQQAYLANLHARTTEDLHTNNNIFKSAAPLVTKTENRRPSMDDPFSIAETVREKVNSNKRLNDKVTDLDEKELQLLISNLKSKIEDAVSSTVDKELNKFFQKRNDELKQDEIKKQNYLKEQLQNNHVNREIRRENEPEKKTTDHSLDHILQMPSKPPATNGFPLPGRHSAFELPKISGRIPEIPRAPFPHPPPLGYPPLSFYLPPTLHGPSMYSCPLVPPEQTEALALVVNTPQKKKRTKVTDTRLSPRAARALLHENGALDQDRPMSGFSPMTASCLPTSVAIPNPSLHHSDILSFYKDQSLCRSPMDPERHSPSSSHSPSEGFGFMKGDYFNDGDTFDSNGKITDTLTPMHLRKAKLMFFYVRYPSSAIIKVYFPDVQFNKNNTAQLVKWFSNFREFYYIQMEKYARQAIAEGCKHAEDLVVGTDSELYRTLNLHYNRNNQIDVPDNFRLVVQATLREFFAALMANKDSEPSWKKPIYKVIARMDDILPEYFKSPNWMDQLGDA